VNILGIGLPGNLIENGHYFLRLDLCEDAVSVLENTVVRAQIAEPMARNDDLSAGQEILQLGLRLGFGRIAAGLYEYRVLKRKEKERLDFYGGKLPDKTQTNPQADHDRNKGG